MRNKALNCVKKYNMISENDHIIVALSGGADSCALLHFIISLKSEMNIEVSACHVNHMIRGQEADRDEEFVRNLCIEYGIPLYVKKTDVLAEAKRRRIGTEQCGREIRYEFFSEKAAQLDAKIATAHTASDNAETIIFNMTRGCGISGLCGIPPVRDRIIRPLIGISRSEIEQYCQDNSLEYITDSTNLTTEYNRNKIRLDVIPVLRSVNPEVDNTMCKFSERMMQLKDYLIQKASEIMDSAKTEKGYRTDILKETDMPILSEIMRLICKQYGHNPDAKHIELIREIVYNGGAVELQRDLKIVVKQGYMRVAAGNQSKKAFPSVKIPLKVPDEFVIGNKKVNVLLVDSDDFNNSENNYRYIFKNYLDYDKITMSEVFRTRTSGDVFAPLNRGLTKTVKKLFCELKIPQEKRDTLLMLAHGNDIVWIEDIGVSDKYKVTESSRKIMLLNVSEDE